LALENSAGGGDGMGVSIEELAGMLDAAGAVGADTGRLCFCLDTAHLWGAGTDVADPDAVDALLDRFDRLLGAERLALIHLNDSKVGRGSHLDRHQHVGAGAIGARGLRHLLRHPRLSTVPIVIETPGMDEGYDLVNMERMRQLLEDDGDLPELPADALALRRSRSRTEPPQTTPDRTGAALRA
jgi:deoxyribonuclease-4